MCFWWWKYLSLESVYNDNLHGQKADFLWEAMYNKPVDNNFHSPIKLPLRTTNVWQPIYNEILFWCKPVYNGIYLF